MYAQNKAWTYIIYEPTETLRPMWNVLQYTIWNSKTDNSFLRGNQNLQFQRLPIRQWHHSDLHNKQSTIQNSREVDVTSGKAAYTSKPLLWIICSYSSHALHMIYTDKIQNSTCTCNGNGVSKKRKMSQWPNDQTSFVTIDEKI